MAVTQHGKMLGAIRDNLAEALQIDPDRIGLHTNFVEDLGADSLDLVEIIMELEDPLGISIPDAEAQELKTTEDVIRYLETHASPEQLANWLDVEHPAKMEEKRQKEAEKAAKSASPTTDAAEATSEMSETAESIAST